MAGSWIAGRHLKVADMGSDEPADGVAAADVAAAGVAADGVTAADVAAVVVVATDAVDVAADAAVGVLGVGVVHQHLKWKDQWNSD